MRPLVNPRAVGAKFDMVGPELKRLRLMVEALAKRMDALEEAATAPKKRKEAA